MKKTGYLTAALLVASLGLTGCSVFSTNANPNDYTTRTQTEIQGDKQLQHALLNLYLQGDSRYGESHVNVDAYNGYVLLTGQVPSQDLKDLAGEAAKRHRGVSGVRNELTVGENTSRTQRIKDSWITTRITSKLWTNNRINGDSVHVITENGSVYLMGHVSHRQADTITATATPIDGVKRVVKVFHYID
ncbi:BON domain-containing protein [Larsenimonas rhizosphaerae]|uniref:BON domain-containing protein n=1 Tax=Larsenimonas rhizosphaerae TaxID=2944682 RepID=A0AA42CTM0_9GAMM|nr:BON domain-containing protein [Larsenimonas rhizosphaerae]MCX2523762.1 BON domain-containing protein [Larsenimonas rhizosphaerae]